MCCFFIADVIQWKPADVERMPAEELIGDVCTKSLTGSAFRRMRSQILSIVEEDQPKCRKACGKRTTAKIAKKEAAAKKM